MAINGNTLRTFVFTGQRNKWFVKPPQQTRFARARLAHNQHLRFEELVCFTRRALRKIVEGCFIAAERRFSIEKMCERTTLQVDPIVRRPFVTIASVQPR